MMSETMASNILHMHTLPIHLKPGIQGASAQNYTLSFERSGDIRIDAG